MSAVIETGEMPTVHTFFRREFRLAAGVVRGVRAGDVRRARVVARHLDYLARSLHDHHTAEDELAWPLLLERVPDELAPMVHLMESQHERVGGLLAEIGRMRPRWASTADPGDRDRIADLLDALYGNLAEHLDAEEERLVPIAARAMTRDEWEELGRRARRDNRPSEALVTFGMIQHEGDPVVVAGMISGAPAPVRWLLPKLARRAFRRYALRIHGTATP